MLSPKTLRKNPSLLLLASGGCWQSLVFLGLWQHNSNLCLCLHMVIFYGSVSKFPSSYNDTNHWVRDHPNPAWPHLNLIITAKILFPHKSHSIGSRWTRIWGDTIQPNTPHQVGWLLCDGKALKWCWGSCHSVHSRCWTLWASTLFMYLVIVYSSIVDLAFQTLFAPSELALILPNLIFNSKA